MKRSVRYLLAFAVTLLVILAVCTAMPDLDSGKETEKPVETREEEKNESQTEEAPFKEENKEPYVVSSASIGVTGDILIHETVYKAAQRAGGIYGQAEEAQKRS